MRRRLLFPCVALTLGCRPVPAAPPTASPGSTDPAPPSAPTAPEAGASTTAETPVVEAPPPTEHASPASDTFREIWTVDTGDWNHGVLVLDSGDVISQSMWKMRVHARHDGSVLRTAKTCGARRSSAFVQVAPDRALLACSDELREYTLPISRAVPS